MPCTFQDDNGQPCAERDTHSSGDKTFCYPHWQAHMSAQLVHQAFNLVLDRAVTFNLSEDHIAAAMLGAACQASIMAQVPIDTFLSSAERVYRALAKLAPSDA